MMSGGLAISYQVRDGRKMLKLKLLQIESTIKNNLSCSLSKERGARYSHFLEIMRSHLLHLYGQLDLWNVV
jgi:hypothetical protein